MTVRTVLKVPFEKAAHPPLLFWRSGTPVEGWGQTGALLKMEKKFSYEKEKRKK